MNYLQGGDVVVEGVHGYGIGIGGCILMYVYS